GGVELFAAGTPTVMNNQIVGNSATYGAGIEIVNRSDAAITQNVISGNQGQVGGGIYMVVGSDIRGPFLVNNTITANSAAAIYTTGFPTTVEIDNNVVVGVTGSAAIVCDTTYSSTPPVRRSNNVSGA